MCIICIFLICAIYSDIHIKFPNIDVKDVASFPNVRQQIESDVGDTGLNLLINNAGIMFGDSLEKVSKETMMENFEVNVVSPLLLTKVSYVFYFIYKYCGNFDNSTSSRE